MSTLVLESQPDTTLTWLGRQQPTHKQPSHYFSVLQDPQLTKRVGRMFGEFFEVRMIQKSPDAVGSLLAASKVAHAVAHERPQFWFTLLATLPPFTCPAPRFPTTSLTLCASAPSRTRPAPSMGACQSCRQTSQLPPTPTGRSRTAMSSPTDQRRGHRCDCWCPARRWFLLAHMHNEPSSSVA